MENIQNLPIDIQTSKLSDWLLDRRHCNVKWQSAIKTIREKINTAIQDMPENEEIKQLLSGSYIHYFHCLRIVEILKGTEASSKNIFGRYSSQRMKVETNSCLCFPKHVDLS
uniref:CDK5 regulatory subunit associated protein 3 n=1 Tax=Nothobranchius furzeri TaxID=105023 RepID=A0A8C6LTS9_NOTFU